MIDYISLRRAETLINLIKGDINTLDETLQKSIKYADVDSDTLTLNFYNVSEPTPETEPILSVPLADTKEMYVEATDEQIRAIWGRPEEGPVTGE